MSFADALSRRPRVNAVSTVHHDEFSALPSLYKYDNDFKEVWADLNQAKAVSPYSLKDGFLYHQQAICVAQPLRQKVMDEAHASPYAGHRGIMPTTQALERYFYWPSMRTDIERYVRECLICQKVKYDRHKTPGLLQPLPIPEAPWESIAMDFITDLPRTQYGNDAIWTIIDRFSKQAHFLPIRKKIKADHMAKLFLAHIFNIMVCLHQLLVIETLVRQVSFGEHFLRIWVRNQSFLRFIISKQTARVR